MCQALHERLDAVHAGEDEPVEGVEHPYRLIQRTKILRRLYLDGRELEDLSPQGLQLPRQLPGLGPRPRDHDPPPEERLPLEPVESFLAQRHDVSHDRDRGRLQVRLRHPFSYVLQGTGNGTLLGNGTPAEAGDRGLGVASARDELIGDLREPPHAHIQDQRLGTVREPLPVHIRLPFSRIFMAGYEGDARGDTTMRDGDTGVGRRGYTARHAGDYFERQPGAFK